jgi:hypothetical protein
MSSIIRVLSIQESFECAVVGFRDLSEENGRGSGARTLGEATYPRLAISTISSTALHTFGGTRVETMFAVFWYGWDG